MAGLDPPQGEQRRQQQAQSAQSQGLPLAEQRDHAPASAGSDDPAQDRAKASISFTRRSPPAPNAANPARPLYRLRRRALIERMVSVAGARAATVRVCGPITPSVFTSSADCSSRAAVAGPMFTAASRTTRSSPAGNSPQRDAAQ